MNIDFSTVAIVDDDEAQAEVMSEVLRDAGLLPIIYKGRYRWSANAAAEAIGKKASSAVCDHRLSHGVLARFAGAELAATLFRKGIPAVLVTQFIEQDRDVSIRRWRQAVPVVLSREQAEPDTIIAGLNQCRAEILGDRAPQRQTYRCLIEIADERNVAGEKIFDVIVPQWNENLALGLPAKLIPRDIRKGLKVGKFFFARVNIGASEIGDIFFESFEKAPKAEEIKFD